MGHLNKTLSAVGLAVALLAFLLVLVGVISTDGYSLAAQAQANGDLALMAVNADPAHGNKSILQFTAAGENQVVPE